MVEDMVAIIQGMCWLGGGNGCIYRKGGGGLSCIVVCHEWWSTHACSSH